MSHLHQRIKDLEDNLKQDLELLKELDDKFRLEDDPSKRKEIEKKQENLKISIDQNKKELQVLEAQVKGISDFSLSMTEINFEDLDIAATSILQMPINQEELDFKLIPPTEKMSKNDLSQSTQYLIILGLMKSKDVHKYVEHRACLIPDYPDRLKAGFVNRYNQLKQKGLEGDILFNELHSLVSKNNEDFSVKTARLAVLCYFFERCEIFEK